MRRDLPSGTVTFLFTDVEGSTRLLHELGDEAYADVLAEHRRLIRAACVSRGGVEVDTQGDAFFFAFASAPEAIAAAGAATETLAAGRVHVRIGLHSGTPFLGEEGYVGGDVHRAARIAAAGHGGQVLVSAATAALIEPSGSEPQASSLLDLGAHRLKDFPEPVTLYQLGEGSFPPLKTIANTNLPTPASSFLGREEELYQADLLMQETRLLTVTGPGGAGKTRFSLELARRAREERFSDYADGVFACFLASLRDPSLVLPTIAQTLSLRQQPGLTALETLSSQLQGKKLLLLLDNLEHLLGCAHELSELSQACPDLTLLTTSRELLRLDGEHPYYLPPLAEAEGVALVCERARVAPSQTIRELCARLEGLPLALELAAARLRLLSPEQLLERLSGRLDLLKAGRDADPRQQTLRATIQWSYDLLSSEEQTLFARLSVFAGGCTLDAAEAVCEADLDALESLLDKSLLRRSDSELGPRFWMLETIREYAAERLQESGEAQALHNRHAEFFLALAERLEPAPLGGLKEDAIHELRAETDNFRLAIHFSSQRLEPEGELRLVGSLFRLWELAGLVKEGRRLTEHALQRSKNADPRLRIKVLYSAYLCAANSLDVDEARTYAEEALDLARKVGDDEAAAVSLNNLGTIEMEATGDFLGAAVLLDQSAELAREIGDDVILLAVAINRGAVALTEGNPFLARTLLEEALPIAMALDEPEDRAYVLGNLGHALLGLNEPTSAALRYCEALELSLRFAGPRENSANVDGLSAAAIAVGDAVRAARLAGISESWRLDGDSRQASFERDLIRRTERTARAKLGDDAWEVEHARGAGMGVNEAVSYALEARPDA